MKYDFNVLELSASQLIKQERFRDALRIYLYMSDGDPSLDGGYLGRRLAQCYESLGELHAARYWYGRAIEENPVVNQDCIALRDKLGEPFLDDILLHQEDLSSST